MGSEAEVFTSYFFYCIRKINVNFYFFNIVNLE